MKPFAAAIGAFALATFVVGHLPVYVPVSGLVLAGIVYLSRDISAYLRIFVAMYAAGYVFLCVTSVLAGYDVIPPAIGALLPPPYATSAAVAFALIVYGVSFVPVIRSITAIADPYFEAADSPRGFGRPFAWLARREGGVGARLVATLVVINFFQVAMQIRLNVWYRDLFNALQEKNVGAFWVQIFEVFAPLATIWISVAVYELFVTEALTIRWRAWLTRRMTGRWLEGGTHYRISLSGDTADNPDQRIQSDIRAFIIQTMDLSIRLLSQAATLVSFVIILWGLSRDFAIPGTDGVVVPGFLVWVVIAYAVVGTWLTHVIGKPLIGLDFRQEKVEADFRFSLARLREYGEQVALLRGERAETERLDRSFANVVANFLQILSRRMKLTTFTAGYSQLSVIFPYVLAAPSYFLGKITLGQFQQTSGAFNQVQGSMSFFISAYTTLAAYKANIDRLTTFNAAMSRAEDTGRRSAIKLTDGAGADLGIAELRLALPDGRHLLTASGFAFRAGERTLVTGPSGSGKSTLFRALSGIWPFGEGSVAVPAGRSMMLLPQKPYLPTGTLRAAVTYPGVDAEYGDAEVRSALAAVRLGDLADRLDEEDAWAQRLSGGEQQRLAIARALLAKPDWLFLDEATASLDEPMEAEIYAALRERLPATTIVSIGHRTTLIAMHDRQVAVQPGQGPDGQARDGKPKGFELRDRARSPEAAPAE